MWPQRRSILPALLFLTISIWSCNKPVQDSAPAVNMDRLMIRVAEIEIDSAYFDACLSILKEEAEASVRLEPGVICIYPMFIQDNPTSIRLLEIYASREDYESHLQTEHFQKYKTSTRNMVKSLELVDMAAIDTLSMPAIFTKLKE